MKLFTTKDCEPCNEVKEYIISNNLKIEIIEVSKNENGMYDIGGQPFNTKGRAFPMLEIIRGNISNLLCGKEGILQILENGFIYEDKECPYLKHNCRREKCAKFAILYRGAVPEGGCSDFWNAILSTEIISSLQSLRKELANGNTSESESNMGK